MNVRNSTQGNETFTWAATTPAHTSIILLSILLVWSLLGNIFVISVVYCKKNLRKNLNFLIVNMAVSDLLVPLVAMPWHISSRMVRPSEWLVDGPLGEALCTLVPFLSDISPFVSSISLVIIAFQRYMYVVYPIRKQILSRKTRWIAISFPWIVAMVFRSPYLYTYRLTKARGYTVCNYSWSPAFDYWTAELIVTSIDFTVGFVIPLILIIILYAITVYKLRQNLNNVTALIGNERIRSRQRRNRRIFSMILTILLIFTICWCPIVIFYSLHLSAHFSLRTGTMSKLFFAFVYMWYLQAAINPYIYFVFLADFRRGLKSLCCRKTATANKLLSGRPRTPGGDSNQDPTCTPTHINTTSV